MTRKTVNVVDSLLRSDGELYPVIVAVTVNWVCPVCGGPRGEPRKFRFFPNRSYLCDRWDNPCGHIDKYDAVLIEAKHGRQP